MTPLVWEFLVVPLQARLLHLVVPLLARLLHRLLHLDRAQLKRCMAEGGWVVLATSERRCESRKYLEAKCHLFLWSFWVLEVVRRSSGGAMNEVR